MRDFLFFICVSLLLLSCGNSNLMFPKKYLGNYHGIQESYLLSIDNAVIKIPEASYDLVLIYEKLWLTSHQQSIKATYTLKAETNLYYTFLVKLENGVTEEWQLWKKGKRLIRNAIAPQPDTIFIQN